MNRFFSHFEQPSTSSMLCVGIIAGVLSTVFWWNTWKIYACLCILVLFARYSKGFLYILAGVILGICVTLGHYAIFYSANVSYLKDQNPITFEIKVKKVINQQSQPYVKAQVLIADSHKFPKWGVVNTLLTLSDVPGKVSVGDVLRGEGALKPFRSRKNMSLFDREVNAFREQVYFKGKLKGVSIVEKASTQSQAKYRNYIHNSVSGLSNAWLYYVLLTGDKSKIPDEQKAMYQVLGLSHLLAISGLHVGIIFFLTYVISKVVLICLPVFKLSQTMDFRYVFGTMALLFSLAYVWISGWAVSAQRAYIMSAVALACLLVGRDTSPLKVCTLALAMILVLDPFTALNPGLYFSFMAVIAIFLSLKYPLNIKNKTLRALVRLVLVQAFITLLLLPLNSHYFTGFSLSGMLVNIIVIPALTFVIFPSLIAFIVIRHELVFEWMQWADQLYLKAIAVFYEFKYWVDLPFLPVEWVVIIYSTASVAYLLKQWVWLAPLVGVVGYKTMLEEPASWSIDVFDVGHGTAVMISQNKKAIMYDLGASYFKHFSLFSSVIQPYIKKHDIELSHVIISHNDNDHAGGLPDLKAGYGSHLFLPFHKKDSLFPCKLGDYHFGQLEISVIWPTTPLMKGDNNQSCVVKITDGRYTLLLPGDIEYAAEKRLLAKYPHNFKSTFLLAPHHGSKSSSSEQFILEVMPELVIFSRGFYSFWQLPHPAVKQRYEQYGVQTFDTAIDGHIRIEIFDRKYSIRSARQSKNDWFLR